MKTQNSLIRSLTVIGLLSAATTQIHAQGTMYVSNLGETSYDGGPFDYGQNTAHALSVGFISGTNAGGYNLDSIQILMGNNAIGPGGFYVSIFTDNGGQPGTSLGSLSGSPSPYIAGTYTYTSSGIELSSLTPYWLVVSSDSPYFWEDTLSANYISNEGWSIVENGSSEQLQFGVNADPLGIDPVPEPGTLAFLGLEGLAVMLIRRRK